MKDPTLHHISGQSRAALTVSWSLRLTLRSLWKLLPPVLVALRVWRIRSLSQACPPRLPTLTPSAETTIPDVIQLKHSAIGPITIQSDRALDKDVGMVGAGGNPSDSGPAPEMLSEPPVRMSGLIR